MIETMERLGNEYEHVTIEVPPGQPQSEFFEQGQQWTPRGDVLGCVISDGALGNDPIVHIDEHDLSWEEFGRLLTPTPDGACGSSSSRTTRNATSRASRFAT